MGKTDLGQSLKILPELVKALHDNNVSYVEFGDLKIAFQNSKKDFSATLVPFTDKEKKEISEADLYRSAHENFMKDLCKDIEPEETHEF